MASDTPAPTDTDPHIRVMVRDDHVAVVELHRPPNNFFSVPMVMEIADALEALDEDDSCRVVVLCAAGKHFCAGADFSAGREVFSDGELYEQAARLVRTRKPIVAAVQGACIGGGLGVAMVCDFRLAAPEARFSANFARLGFHQGFGLSATLPRVLGPQRAAELLYTGRRLKGDEAVAMGLADRLVPLDELREAACAFAGEIAGSAPLAVESIRETLRANLPEEFVAATQRELGEQSRLRATADFAEGTAAMGERREPRFTRT